MSENHTSREELIALGDIVSIARGTINPNLSSGERFIYYSIPGYDATGGALETLGKEIQSNKTLLENDCVLISKLNPRIPRVCHACISERGRTICSTEFIPLVPRHESVALEYLTHYLRSPVFQERFQAAAGGSTNSHSRVTAGEILDWEVFIPPLPEQKKIAEILSGIGRQSTLYQQKIDAVISEKKALLNSLFRTPFEGNALLQELCEEDICYGVLQYNEAGEATIPVIQIRNLEPLNLTNTKMIPLSLDQKYSRSRVIANDLLVSVKGSVGKIAVIPKGFSGNISRDIARVRTRTSVVLPHFLKHWFASDPGCDALSRIEVGTTRAELSIGKMRTLRISYPSLEKQEEICRIANSLDETLSSLSKQVEKYDLLKQAIGSDLLSGRKRVSI
jgi:type I restriction enzyme, S subunit